MHLLAKSLIILTAAGAVAAAVTQRDADASAPPAPQAPQAPPAVVEVAPVVSAPFAPLHWAPGSVISTQDARVASEQAGRIVSIAEVGTHLRAGEPLAAMEDTALRLREREAAAELGRIQAQLALAVRQESRYAQLAAQQNIARAQYEQLQAEREVLAQQRAGAEATLAQTRHQRSQMVVRAPFAGVVVERLGQLGEYLAPGTAVARLVDTDHLEVRVRAPVDLARQLEPGAQVRLRSGSVESNHRVTALVPVGDEASRQLDLRIDATSLQLPVGSAVDVGLPSDRVRDVLAAPRDALILRREGNAVLRVNASGKAERVAVETGEALDGLVEVRGALHAGDRLIVRGVERVQPGQAVSIQAPAAAVAAR